MSKKSSTFAPENIERIQIMRPSVIPNTGYMPNYDLGMSASYPKMSLAELENNSLSVE